MKEFKIRINENIIFTYSETADGSYVTMRRTYEDWLFQNLLSFFTFKFKYTPLYVCKNLEGYSINDMEVTKIDENTVILRFDKCCKKPGED